MTLHLAGGLSAADQEIIRGYVHQHGYLPHRESVALMRSSDLLFLPMHDLAGGRRARLVPGKTYEYLASGRPILAAVPEGDARDLLGQAENAYLCRPTDVDGMARAIKQAFERKRRGMALPPAGSELLAPFERRVLTQKLATVFDAVLGRESRPGDDSPDLSTVLDEMGRASRSDLHVTTASAGLGRYR
jgi:glycosyltransferase involved in cell wall biosynthesis